MGLIPGSGRSPGGGHGDPLQYHLENPVDRGVCQATVPRPQSRTLLQRLGSMHVALPTSHHLTTAIQLWVLSTSHCTSFDIKCLLNTACPHSASAVPQTFAPFLLPEKWATHGIHSFILPHPATKSASARELTSQRVTLNQWRPELDNAKADPHLALEISCINIYMRASLVAQMGKNPPAMLETQV